MKFLEDSAIRLRAVEPEDAERMFEFERDSEQWLHNGMSAPFSRHNLTLYALEYDADPVRSRQIRFVVEETAGKRIVGLADLYEIDTISGNAFVGIYIAPASRRKGYAAKAVHLLGQYAGQVLNLRVLGAKVSDSNQSSVALFRRCGFMLSGRLPGWLRSGRDISDLLIFTMPLEH